MNHFLEAVRKMKDSWPNVWRTLKVVGVLIAIFVTICVVYAVKKMEDSWPNVCQALKAVGTWIAAGATIYAVWFAVRLKREYDRRDRPVLSVKIEKGIKECFGYIGPEYFSTHDDSLLPSGDDREELWLKVLVSSSGNTAAKDVQIRLIEMISTVRKPQSRSHLWFKVSNLNKTALNILPHGIDQPFDVAYVCRTINKNTQSSQTVFYLMIVQPEIDDKPWLEIKNNIEKCPENKLALGYEYELEIVVLSSNADAVKKKFKLTFRDPAADSPKDQIIGEDSLKGYLDLKVVEID